MSVSTTPAAAAIAQKASGNRPGSRRRATPISGNRPQLLGLAISPASPLRICAFLQPMPHQMSKSCYLSPPAWRLRAFVSGEVADGGQRGSAGRAGFSLDEVLIFIEMLCIAPSVVCAIGGVASLLLRRMSVPFQIRLGNALFVWQFVLLVGAVAVGTVIRRRQWQRFCRENGASLSLIDRVEKAEEDLRSSATIIRVLSRQLEKLGIRFRVTRKTLREPISETAALAQKNSEATRALALQADILEKELGEIQKVLLAMQEHQRKQLELILAIGKAGRLLETKKDVESKQEAAARTGSSFLEEKEQMKFQKEKEKPQVPRNDQA